MKSVRTAGLACAAFLGVPLLGCTGSAPSVVPQRIAVCDTLEGPAEQPSPCPEPTCNPRITERAQPVYPPEETD